MVTSVLVSSLWYVDVQFHGFFQHPTPVNFVVIHVFEKNLLDGVNIGSCCFEARPIADSILDCSVALAGPE